MVNPVKTPIAYIAIKAVTRALVAISRISARTARTIIPLENTSLCPRLVNCLGKKESAAVKEAKKGNQVKEVLAANTKIIVVDICKNRYRKRPIGPVP